MFLLYQSFEGFYHEKMLYFVKHVLWIYWLLFGFLSHIYMAPHSSTLAWKIPWMEEPGGLQSWGRWVGHDWATSLSLSCIGEGNGNPLPCSCLENPRDGGAWWGAVSGVSQSRTQLKRLSSSSVYVYIYIYIFNIWFWSHTEWAVLSQQLQRLQQNPNETCPQNSCDFESLDKAWLLLFLVPWNMLFLGQTSMSWGEMEDGDSVLCQQDVLIWGSWNECRAAVDERGIQPLLHP